MSVPGIRDREHIRQIESRPYAAFLPHASVLAALEHSARAHADRRALTYIPSADLQQPPTCWTHAEFIAQVRRAACLFQRLAGDEAPRVAMLLPAIPQAYFTLWGAEAAGIACPVNYLLGAQHIAELLGAAEANILVALGPNAELDIWPRIAEIRARCPQLRCVLAVGAPDGDAAVLDFDRELAATRADDFVAPCEDPDRLAALFHTGGTTGRPKLAMQTQRNQLHAAWGAARMYGAGPADVMLNGFPLFHVAGSMVYGLSTLLAGGEVLLPTLLGMRNADFVKAYWRCVERHRVSLLATVPTVISALLGVERGDADLSSVRALLTGGSPLPTELADGFELRFGIPVRNILGMTECGGVIAIEPVAGPRVAGTVRLALPFTRLRVVDERGLEVAAGVDGVLQISGPNIGPGYTDASRNAGTFTDDGWLVSGDIAHIDADGRVFVTGRAKDLIIRSGHNIDPIVIEDALLRHPDVLMAAAVGAPDEYAGEIPVAFVSLRPGAEVTVAALQDFAQRFIPERPAFPKRIVVLESLPMTAIGKLFKPELRAQAVRAVLADRLAGDGLETLVTLEVLLEPRGPVAEFSAAVDAGLQARIRKLMSGFALEYRLSRQHSNGDPDR